MNDAEKTANEHWKYTEGIINKFRKQEMSINEILKLCKYLYIQAFIHGFKHGVEES